jgi:maleate isomerase
LTMECSVKAEKKFTRLSMDAAKKVHIGLLTSRSGDRPHFDDFRGLVPAEVGLTIESVGVGPEATVDARSEAVLRRVTEIVRDHRIEGLIITGAPLTVLNPDIEKKITEAITIPATTPIRAATAALHAINLKKLILMTPFDDEINLRIQDRLKQSGLTVLSCPSLEYLGARTGTHVPADKIFGIMEKIVHDTPGADAIYFQGAPFNPLPIIDRIESELKLPVIASNPAMLWHILSLLGHKFSIQGYGRLLASWPALS